MTTEEEQIQKQINLIWNELNAALSEFNNGLLLFDFTTVFYKGENYGKVQSTYKYAINGYPKLLDEYFEKHGYSVQKQENNETGEIIPDRFSLEDTISELALIEPKDAKFDPKKDEKMTLVGLDTWHNFIEEKKFAAASWILFKDFFNDNSGNERIEVGLYVLLKNPVKGWINNCIDSTEKDNAEKINELLSTKAYKFLFNSGIGYIADEFKKRKEEIQKLAFEKEQLNREKMLYVGMGHYIKNSTLGLEAHENEIIQYLKSLSNTDDKVLVTAQLQKLIYSLIRLYLQIRQIAGSGVIDTKTTNTKVQVNLYNLINLIYLHTIITRGKFYIALDNPSNLDTIKAVVIHQNEIIGKLTDLLQNQTFFQSDIDAVLAKSEDIDSFHSLSKSGYEILIKIDPKLKMNVELNSIQFKYLYTVFAEIFDNCFSSKHSSGSRTAYLYLGNDSQEYKTIIISSRDSSIDMETMFKFDENEMCNNCDSTGNGIKIIQSALANEYLNSTLLIPRDSKSKSFTMSNGGEISVFEYNVKLNKNLFV